MRSKCVYFQRQIANVKKSFLYSSLGRQLGELAAVERTRKRANTINISDRILILSQERNMSCCLGNEIVSKGAFVNALHILSCCYTFKLR